MTAVRQNAQQFSSQAREEDLKGILDFARKAKVETGFGYLNSDGTVDTSRPVELWITCRMTHVYALAHLQGYEGAAEIAKHGVDSLRGPFHDEEYGGWYSAISHELQDLHAVDERKAAYAHAFVVLAASSATIAGIEGARELLDQALSNQDERWWEAGAEKVYESFDRTFTQTEAYRGVNANMHTTECYLAAYDATDDEKWLARALGILQWVIDGQARNNNWRIPEHYDPNWNVIGDYNIDKPKDPFRPYGYTPGHGLEWARLALHAGSQWAQRHGDAPEWILPAARALFEQAIADGWHADGQDGFVYTNDDDGQPVARERMHWVLCEALGAATVLADALAGEGGYTAQQRAAAMGMEADFDSDRGKNLTLIGEIEEETQDAITQLVKWCDLWWDYAQSYLIEKPGHWYHELDHNNQVSTVTWPGKPDAYHVVQCLLLPDLPVAPTFARALREAK
ncbi:MAG: AGE family epimerase/isomerase [Actinomycetaceae bacterium]|nr:AGE family epimerase/isomerase [Actinomycetaceae bacterium]